MKLAPAQHLSTCVTSCPFLSFPCFVMSQVPGMSRKEASALFQEGIVNVKSLLSASKDRVATALRINVPFRPVDRAPGQPGSRGVMATRMGSSVPTASLGNRRRFLCVWSRGAVRGVVLLWWCSC